MIGHERLSRELDPIEAQRTLADALPILVMLAGPDGVVEFFNRRWYEYTGQTPLDRHEGDEWQACMHPDDGAGVREAWYAAVSRGERVVRMRYRLREAATGDYRWFRAQAVAIEDERGAILQWIGAAVDVSEEVDAGTVLAAQLGAQITVAERYQHAALPSGLPAIPGVRFDAEYRAREDELLVGGDWYDAFRLDDGRIAVSIGDVAGHGLDAAVTMTMTRQSGRAIALWCSRHGRCEPAEILDAMEEALMSEHGDRFATAIFGIIDPAAGTFEYASAGHPPPLMKSIAGRVEQLSIGGTPLGCPAGTRPSFRVSITETSALVLYTDGVVESTRDLDAGLEELRAAVQEIDLAQCENAAVTLLDRSGAALDDDAAILVVHFTDRG